MKTLEDVKPVPQFKLLAQGAPLVGKTTTCLLEFPTPYIADCDHNVSTSLLLVKKLKPEKRVFWDSVRVDDKGERVPLERQWVRLLGCVQAACANPEIETIIIDSLTSVTEMLEAHITQLPTLGKQLTIANLKVMDQAQWRPFKLFLVSLIHLVEATGKHFVLVAHEQVDTNEMSGAKEYTVALPGQLRNSIGKMFTAVWRFEAEERGGVIIRKVRTVAQPRNYGVGTRSVTTFPAEWVFSWDEFVKIYTGVQA